MIRGRGRGRTTRVPPPRRVKGPYTFVCLGGGVGRGASGDLSFVLTTGSSRTGCETSSRAPSPCVSVSGVPVGGVLRLPLSSRVDHEGGWDGHAVRPELGFLKRVVGPFRRPGQPLRRPKLLSETGSRVSISRQCPSDPRASQTVTLDPDGHPPCHGSNPSPPWWPLTGDLRPPTSFSDWDRQPGRPTVTRGLPRRGSRDGGRFPWSPDTQVGRITVQGRAGHVGETPGPEWTAGETGGAGPGRVTPWPGGPDAPRLTGRGQV